MKPVNLVVSINTADLARRLCDRDLSERVARSARAAARGIELVSLKPQGRWERTGRFKGKTTAWGWRWSLRWGCLPWPRRCAVGGVLRPVYRWRWP